MDYIVNIKDLKLLIDGLNNALATYGDIIWAVQYGCNNFHSKYNIWNNLSKEQLINRFKQLKNCMISYWNMKINKIKCNC